MSSINKKSVTKPPLIRRLYFQLVVLGAFAVAIAILLFTWKVGSEQLAFALRSDQTQAQTLVRNTALVAGNYLVTKDFGALEELLLHASAFPEVDGLIITDSTGTVFANVQRGKEGIIEPFFNQQNIDLPASEEEFVSISGTTMKIWQPIEKGSLGWVRLEYSLESAEIIQAEIWRNGITSAVIAFVISVLILVLLLKKPMRAIGNATKFARGLYKNTGKVMQFEKSAFEIEQLEHALSYASHQIYSSNKDLTDIKLALDAHAVVGITDQDGKLTYVNDKFCDLTGYLKGELLGKNYSILDSGFNDDDFFKSLWGTIRRGQIWHGEIQDKRKDGSYYWVDTTIVPFINKQGKPYQYVGIQTDITERKEVTNELREYQEHLEEKVEERTHKLKIANSELESFCYSVSHDLRAPLRSIDGFSQALLEDYSAQLDEQACNYLNRVCASSQRMGELIDDLLSLSKVVRSDMSTSSVNLGKLATRVIEQLTERDPARKVDFNCTSGCMVSGDERLLLVMFENLIGNAWKFTSRTENAQIEFGVEHKEDHKVYYVRDNGAGFDEKYKHKMFEPFQRLHSNEEYEGSGIGLATVQRIVRRHEGEVWAESASGNGAIILFTLGE